MNRYRIRYRDQDPDCPVFSGVWHGYDQDHAEERFWESDSGDDGWIIESITLVGTRS